MNFFSREASMKSEKREKKNENRTFFRISRQIPENSDVAFSIKIAKTNQRFAENPTLDIAEGTFPVASAIDVWVRDPPAVSSLPARGA